jgi:hypothetical protein
MLKRLTGLLLINFGTLAIALLSQIPRFLSKVNTVFRATSEHWPRLDLVKIYRS